jgi:broad specificity phosphatase PhoE
MRKLILIKHARPAVDPKVSSDQWRLGEEGRAACGPLAEALRGFDFPAIVSSTEPKAAETAQIVGEALGRPVRTAEGLGEHDRRSVPHMETREFISLMALFFKQPGRRVLGAETADEAYARFAAAVDAVVAAEPDDRDIAIVAHGTVIALYAQRRGGQEGYALWRKMGQPSFAVFEAATGKVIEVRERV